MREAGLDGERVNKIRKQLLLSNAIIEQVKLANRKKKTGEASILRNIVAGRILKKYRCVSALSMGLKLDRNRVGKYKFLKANKGKRSHTLPGYSRYIYGT